MPSICSPYGSTWISPVIQVRPDRSPVFFKRYEAGLVTVGASHVKFVETLVLGLLDAVPKEKRHSAQSVEPCITATILGHHCLFVRECEDTRHRQIVLGHNSDLQVFAK